MTSVGRGLRTSSAATAIKRQGGIRCSDRGTIAALGVGGAWRSQSSARSASAAQRVGGRAARPQTAVRLTIDENAWAGATANVYVGQHILEKRLRLQSEHRQASEEERSALPGDGGREGRRPARGLGATWTSRSTRSTLTSEKIMTLGSNGVIGHIGWYIPTYLMKQYPAVQDVAGPEGQGGASSRARSPARRGCSSAATRPTCRRTRS